MNVKKFNDQQGINNQVIDDLRNILQENNEPLICIAGGDTTIPIMEAIAEVGRKDLDLSKASFIGLDEWGGLDRTVKGSCAQTLYDHFFTPLGISEDKIFFFNGKADLQEEAKKATELLEKKPIDYIVLGVGMNGHIGFNEPGVPDSQGSIVVELDSVTKQVMKKYFDKDYDLTEGITLSLSQIRQAKNIVVVINGEHKKAIYQKTIDTVEDKNFPVSLLKNESEKLSLYADSAAYEQA